MTDRPYLTITEAATACKVDRRTIRRRLDAGELPGAIRDDGDGRWGIPIEDLIAAGLRPNAPAPPDEALPELGELGRLRVRELGQLRVDLAAAIKRADVAEAIATERNRVIEAQAIALRALGAVPGPSTPPPAPSPIPAVVEAPRRRWWPRR